MDFGAAEFLANCIDRLPWGVDQKATRHMLFQVYPCLYQTTLILKFDNHTPGPRLMRIHLVRYSTSVRYEKYSNIHLVRTIIHLVRIFALSE